MIMFVTQLNISITKKEIGFQKKDIAILKLKVGS